MAQNLKTTKNNTGLSHLIADHLEKYFQAHNGQLPAPGLYKRVMVEAERPLIQLSLDVVEGNQLKAAEMLGINRNTLRKKLKDLKIKPVRAK